MRLFFIKLFPSEYVAEVHFVLKIKPIPVGSKLEFLLGRLFWTYHWNV